MTVIITDDFIVASATPLTSHLTDQGDAWIERINTTAGVRFYEALPASGVGKIRCSSANVSSQGILLTVDKAVDPECNVALTITDLSGTGQGKAFGVVARYVDTSNYLLLAGYSISSAIDLKIIEVVAGVGTDIGAGSAVPIAIGDIIKIECRGTTAEAFIDTGSGFNSLFSGTVLDRGSEAGVFAGNATGVSTDDLERNWRGDDFVVEEFGAPPVGASSRRHFDSLIGGNI